MRSSLLRRARIPGVLAPIMLLAACAQTPMGPTVNVMPGPGKPFDAFQYDQSVCKQFAQQSVAGQADNANTRGLGAAALTTVLGAGLGAAIGGGRGAAIGAGAGALGGAGIGASTSSNAQFSIQQQYNNAYLRSACTSKGNMVPGYGPMMSQDPSIAHPSTAPPTALRRAPPVVWCTTSAIWCAAPAARLTAPRLVDTARPGVQCGQTASQICSRHRSTASRRRPSAPTRPGRRWRYLAV